MSRLSPFDSRTHLKVEELAAAYHLERLNQPPCLVCSSQKVENQSKIFDHLPRDIKVPSALLCVSLCFLNKVVTRAIVFDSFSQFIRRFHGRIPRGEL